MRRAMVVYESLFGNARAIAYAIAEGLSEALPAEPVAAGHAPATIGPDVGLLVVGGPNHQFGMPRRASRRQAAQDLGAQIDPEAGGLREWLAHLTHRVQGGSAAAFDTRLDHPRILPYVDHASRREQRFLRRRGFVLVAPAEHFFVTSMTGPLVIGETDRAQRWGQALAEMVAARYPSTGD
ncbi:MAG: flavodoxin [Dactylosporangium sp.]|nr:flavodoxin [Dactylosporangium sp.]NNJ60510.1 flavodoxin [Dactylosporangium sp.]